MPANNRCLSNWATVVCQKEELSTHWVSLYLSYSHLLLSARHSRPLPARVQAHGRPAFSVLIRAHALWWADAGPMIMPHTRGGHAAETGATCCPRNKGEISETCMMGTHQITQQHHALW